MIGGHPSLSDYLIDELTYADHPRSFYPIHASTLTNDYKAFCPREAALAKILERGERQQTHNAATRVAFHIGDAYHDLVRDRWARSRSFGYWVCSACGYHSQWPSTLNAFSCDCPGLLGDPKPHYEEISFRHRNYPLTGSIDLMVEVDDGSRVAIEIKSIDKDKFKDLKAPLGEHRVRSLVYLDILESLKVPGGMVSEENIVTSYMIILYVSKGFGTKVTKGFSPFKEFVVKSDPKAANHYLSKLTSLSEGVMPEGICNTSFDGRVKDCTCSLECFSGKYPPGVTLDHWT